MFATYNTLSVGGYIAESTWIGKDGIAYRLRLGCYLTQKVLFCLQSLDHSRPMGIERMGWNFLFAPATRQG